MMNYAEIEKLQRDEDKNNLILVDRLWKLKKASEKKLSLHIQLNKLVRDLSYRENLISHARTLNDPSINKLISDIEDVQESSEINDKKRQSSNPIENSDSVFSDDRDGRRLKIFAALILAAIVFFLLFMFQFYRSLKHDNQLIEYRLSEMRNSVEYAPSNTEHGDKPLGHVTDNPISSSTIMQEPDFSLPPSLRFHGSNTIGEKLIPKLVEAFYLTDRAQDLQWKNSKVPTEKTLAFLNKEKRYETIEVEAHGTSTGFKSLISGETDIAMASRPIKDSEFHELLPSYGNMRSRQAEHILGLDGVAVITHPDNIVSELTIAQLSNIYSGKINNWSQIGGEDQSIVVFARDKNSGTWDTFKSLVLKPESLSLSESASRFESSSELTKNVSRTTGAIGFVALPYIRDAGVIAISATENSLPVMPTRFTIATEDYPLARRLFLYKSPIQNNELVNKFIDFALSEPGQNVVESLGLASQNIKLQKPLVAQDAPAEYRRLTQQAQRLSLNFRFQQGSDKLDNKAQRDLRRLVNFMVNHSEKSLLLFGFSDSVGSSKINTNLSLERARSLEKALHIRGLAPTAVLGFGEQLPLASNASIIGRTKNRRVEVWLR